MTRSQLEHIIRAAGTIADDEEIIVIGSQAILGEFPEAPEELLVSREADVYPRTHEERSDLIDGSIGEGSPFDHVYGYDAHGVGPEMAVLPAGWKGSLGMVSGGSRFGDFETGGGAGEVHRFRGRVGAARVGAGRGFAGAVGGDGVGWEGAGVGGRADWAVFWGLGFGVQESSPIADDFEG